MQGKVIKRGNCTDLLDKSLSPSRIYSIDVQTFAKEFDTVGGLTWNIETTGVEFRPELIENST